MIEAVRTANGETGGSVLELAEAEYMVRARGYLTSLDDFRAIGVAVGADGTRDSARRSGHGTTRPRRSRRGVAELDGEGEVVGGVIVLRSGANALATIDAVKHEAADRCRRVCRTASKSCKPTIDRR